MKVIDGENAIVGRLAAYSAKKALENEEIVIVNAERTVISGNPKSIIEKYHKRRMQQNKANPEHSPKWPRRPDLMLKRIIRGMLPKHRKRGKEALRKIKVYLGKPKEFENTEKFTFNSDKLKSRYITLEELCKAI